MILVLLSASSKFPQNATVYQTSSLCLFK